MSKTKTLPLKIYSYLDSNLLFNKFGIVNLNLVQSKAPEFTKEELKEMIEEKFKGEFQDGIEFTGE